MERKEQWGEEELKTDGNCENSSLNKRKERAHVKK